MLKPRKLANPHSMAMESEMESTHEEMGELITTLLHSSTMMHMLHLKTESFAAHIALDEIYKALPDLIGTVAEQFQGATKKLLTYKSIIVNPINTVDEAISHLEMIHAEITEFQNMCKLSEIINELDVIKSQIDVTKYKLNFLH